MVSEASHFGRCPIALPSQFWMGLADSSRLAVSSASRNCQPPEALLLDLGGWDCPIRKFGTAAMSDSVFVTFPRCAEWAFGGNPLAADDLTVRKLPVFCLFGLE